MPLADKIRPKTFDEVVGQKHLLSARSPFRRIIESGNIPSLIFYGPPGTGKTTVAEILASRTGKYFYKINATTSSLSELKAVLSETDSLFTGDGILLYIDEIQYFNKKQQQSILEYVEDGRVTLICSTTENPFFYIYPALRSRSAIFEFKYVEPEEIVPALKRALDIMNAEFESQKKGDDEFFHSVASGCGGDVRKAINILESAYWAADEELSKDIAKDLILNAGQHFDNGGDDFYDCLSALQKSIRGSDENAAVHYLARILENGGLLSACRRLLVIANEDIGLAYPMAAVVTKSCVDSALQLGMPEARIPLAHAAILLATSPKSNSAYKAYDAAAADIRNGLGKGFPRCLQNVHADSYASNQSQNYKYPHDFEDSYVEQQYLPDDIKDKKYYSFGNNKNERAAMQYWNRIKKKK